MNPMSAIVLSKIEEIEALHEREREIYGEIRRLGEMVHDNSWDKLAKETVEARKNARSLSEDADANVKSFGLMFEPGSDWGDDPVEITAERIWKDLEPQLLEMFADDPKHKALVEQISKLSAMGEPDNA